MNPGPTPSFPDRNPDALMVPKPFRRMAEPHQLFNSEFGPLLGKDCKRVCAFRCVYGGVEQWFITRSANDTLHFGTSHELASIPRYEWYVVGETDTSPLRMPRPVETCYDEPKTIKFGWLCDQDKLVTATRATKAEFVGTFNEEYASLRLRMARVRELISIQDPSEDNKKELADLLR